MKHTSIIRGEDDGISLRQLLGYVPREQLEELAVDVCGQVAEHVWGAMLPDERPHAHQLLLGSLADLGAASLGAPENVMRGWSHWPPGELNASIGEAIMGSRSATRALAPTATTPELIAQIDAWACPTTDESGPPGHLDDAQRLALRERVQLLASEAVAGGGAP